MWRVRARPCRRIRDELSPAKPLLLLRLRLRGLTDLVGGDYILGIDHRDHELTQHLKLLHLLKGDLVSHLNRLKLTDRALILRLERRERRLFGLKVLCLRRRSLERAVESV